MLPENQNKLLGHSSLFNEIASFYLKDNLPNKILLSGKKGIGKTVFAYHLINYIYLSMRRISMILKIILLVEITDHINLL